MVCRHVRRWILRRLPDSDGADPPRYQCVDAETARRFVDVSGDRHVDRCSARVRVRLRFPELPRASVEGVRGLAGRPFISWCDHRDGGCHRHLCAAIQASPAASRRYDRDRRHARLFFGRLGNFINGELYGRPSNVPWAMVFPSDPMRLPRHPSQLYEGIAEGIVLGLALWILDRVARRRGWYWDGLLIGAFLVGYALIRFLLEFTRQPDAQLGLVR